MLHAVVLCLPFAMGAVQGSCLRPVCALDHQPFDTCIVHGAAAAVLDLRDQATAGSRKRQRDEDLDSDDESGSESDSEVEPADSSSDAADSDAAAGGSSDEGSSDEMGDEDESSGDEGDVIDSDSDQPLPGAGFVAWTCWLSMGAAHNLWSC